MKFAYFQTLNLFCDYQFTANVQLNLELLEYLSVCWSMTNKMMKKQD